MKNLIETTTGILASQMTLTHCGDYAGKFSDSAFDIFESIWESPLADLEDEQWMDIMFDAKGNVYAVWAEDSLTCQNAWCYYVELEKEDCPKAFEEAEEKLTN